MSVSNLKRIALFVQKLLGGPKISKLGHVTLSHAHLGVTLWSGRSRGSVIYIYAKFEADISIRSKVIRGSQNFEIWSRDPGHAYFGVILWFARRRGASSMSVPNLKRIALFVQKLLGGPKISKLGHVTLSHAPFEP